MRSIPPHFFSCRDRSSSRWWAQRRPPLRGAFLTTLYLIVAASELDRPADWALAGVSLGLFLGQQVPRARLHPVILLLVFAHGIRRRLLWALPTATAFALPWYARNWLVAGSPIYPASLAVGGVTLARGAYDRAAMLNTVFHTSELRLFPVMVAHAFGPPLALCGCRSPRWDGSPWRAAAGGPTAFSRSSPC